VNDSVVPRGEEKPTQAVSRHLSTSPMPS
jgi:hypothetical protein